MKVVYYSWFIHVLIALTLGIVGARAALGGRNPANLTSSRIHWASTFIAGAYATVMGMFSAWLLTMVEESMRSTMVWYIVLWVGTGVVLTYSAARWILSGGRLTRQ